MAGVPAGLPAGVRLSDHISLGVIARAVPPDRVRRVLAETGRASERERDLPAQVMVYYAIALALYMGSSTAHSASVTSLGKRRPSRLCCARVVAVHLGQGSNSVSTTR